MKTLLLLALLAAPAKAQNFGPLNFADPAAVPEPVAAVAVASAPAARDFNAYILKAVDQLDSNFSLQGYDISAVLTHDIDYNGAGVIRATKAPKTMCVAAVMEVMLTAYAIYKQETGDDTPYRYLPRESYERLGAGDIKGHIWVNPAFGAYGTADALINFGMGERKIFEELKPGDFVNLNRTNRTGHAVIFLGFINESGQVLDTYAAGVVGFKYFSSQGRLLPGFGGFGFRYGVFSQHGCPLAFQTLGRRDCGIIYSTGQRMLNTGRMLAPALWNRPAASKSADLLPEGESVFHGAYFNGLTVDD